MRLKPVTFPILLLGLSFLLSSCSGECYEDADQRNNKFFFSGTLNVIDTNDRILNVSYKDRPRTPDVSVREQRWDYSITREYTELYIQTQSGTDTMVVTFDKKESFMADECVTAIRMEISTPRIVYHSFDSIYEKRDNENNSLAIYFR